MPKDNRSAIALERIQQTGTALRGLFSNAMPIRADRPVDARSVTAKPLNRLAGPLDREKVPKSAAGLRNGRQSLVTNALDTRERKKS